MKFFSHVLGLGAAAAATCYAQEGLSNPLSVDLTIALVPYSDEPSCDLSQAPSIHFTGFPNTTEVCFDTEVFSNSSFSLNAPGDLLHYNYTLSNAGSYKNTTLYPTLWYQQLSRNSSQNQGQSTVGTLLLKTWPCPNCAMTCDDEGTGSTTSPGLAGPALGQNEWLQWDCFAEGACYSTGYDIKGFTVQTAVDDYNTLNASEQNDKCELAAVSGLYVNNNNTALDDNGKSAGVALRSSESTVWMALGVLASIFACAL